jgi:hypothetical protein
MRPYRSVVILACMGICALSAAQTNPVARKLLKDAQDKCAQIRDPEERATRYADIADVWRPIDKNAALADLNLAAQTLASSRSSNAWKEVLRVWTVQNPDAAFQRALDLNSQRTGEVLARIAPLDINKAITDFGKVPSGQRQDVAEATVRELAFTSEDLCEPFIQGISNVKVDDLYNIVAKDAEDPQLSIKAARLSADNKSSAITEAVRKTADNNPTLAHGFVVEITTVEDRALALAYCAESFNNSNQDNAKQCAKEAILLYDQSAPEWPTRPKLFEKLEPHLSGIDSAEVRDFIQRFTDNVDTHFNNAGGDEMAAQPSWLIECAAAWSRLDLDKARQYAGRALEINPSAGVHSSDGGGDHLSASYRRFLFELAKQDPGDAAAKILSIKGDWPHVYSEAARTLLDDLEPEYKEQARTVAKQFHGDFPNVAETEMEFDQMTADSAADGLLRVESDSYQPEQFTAYSERFVDTLLGADPYRAVRAIINLESAARRIPLLSRVIVAIAKTNPTLAASTYDKATQDLTIPMSADNFVTANTELAKAAFALGH